MLALCREGGGSICMPAVGSALFCAQVAGYLEFLSSLKVPSIGNIRELKIRRHF